MNRGLPLLAAMVVIGAAACGPGGPTASPASAGPAAPSTAPSVTTSATSPMVATPVTSPSTSTPTTSTTSAASPSVATPATSPPVATSPGTPDATASASAGVYAGAGAGDLSPVARQALPRVYVPNTISNTVDVIDPATLKVLDSYPVGREPQHVVPSWDMKTLWVNDDQSNDLVPIDPRTGKRGKAVAVADPYNLYFTPDGAHALVMAERLQRIDVRDPHTMALQRSIPVPCRGVNHADFTADGAFLLASCEYSGTLLVIPVAGLTRVSKVIDLNAVTTPGATPVKEAKAMGGPSTLLDPGASAMPQDVRLVNDGSHFVVADMLRNGVWVIDATTFAVTRFLPTGKGAHGIYPSRNADRLYVSDRDAGSISVLDAGGTKVVAKWPLAPGSSPDMGGVSVDGSRLWLSGRYDSEVYVIDTHSGRTLKTIPVGKGPHGLAVWPQPGSYSLGHTGNMR